MTKKLSDTNIVLIELISRGTKRLQDIADKFEEIARMPISLTTVAKYKKELDDKVPENMDQILTMDMAEAIVRVKNQEMRWYEEPEYIKYVVNVLKPGGRYGGKGLLNER